MAFALLVGSATPAQAQSAPQAVSLAVESSGHTWLLWDNPDGSAALWNLDAAGSPVAKYAYGPYTDGAPQNTWTATAVSVGPSGAVHLLWNNSDRRAMVWNVSAADGTFALAGYGPYTDNAPQNLWNVTALATGPDGLSHLLWGNTDHRAMLWSVQPDFSFTLAGYGPYTDNYVNNDPGNLWDAVSVSADSGGITHLLWRNVDHRAMFWNVDSAFNILSVVGYGPYTDGAAQNIWDALAVATGPDGVSHLLWKNTDGRAMFWNVHADTTFDLVGGYGPYAGLTATALAVGPDNKGRILWNGPNGTAQVWIINNDGTFTAKTYSAVTSGPPYLSNLTVSPTAITGGSNVTGTVTLSSPAPAGGVTVTLGSSNSAVTVPASVVIPAGAIGQIFPVTSGPVADADSLTISGAAAGWVQSASLTILPVSMSIAIQNLDASAGNSLVELSWQDLPEGSIHGYNIYRVNGAVTTLLTNTPQAAPIYVDTGLTNGVSYQYRASVVNLQGQESTLSSTVTATPSSATPTMNWVNPPSTGSDVASLYASMSSGVPIGTMILVDGNIAGSAGETEAGSTAPSNVRGEVDTTALSNGPHTLQMVGYVGDAVAATVPLTIQVNNLVSNSSVSEAFQQDQYEMCSVNAMLPAGTTQWTTRIINNTDGSVVRTWQASSPNVHLSWDGKDSTGTVVADGNYTVELQAAGSILAHKPVALVKGSPNAIALVSKISKNGADDQALATTISGQLARMRASNPGFTYTVWVSNGSAPKHLRRLIKKWMQTTVTDFYIFGHGDSATPRYPPSAHWGGANFWGGNFPSNSDISRDSLKVPELHFIVPTITAGRQYNFAMIDGCESAGGDGQGNIVTPDFTWASAFNIGTNQNFSSCFFGWDGGAGLNTFQDGTSSDWLKWRQLFWTHLADGGTVYQSAQYASMHTPPPYGTVNPWDQSGSNYRAQEEEDTNLP